MTSQGGATHSTRETRLGGLAPEDGPLASVIITTRNNASTIGQLLESIAHQTYGRQEAIVVDNRSTDGTPGIAAEYGCKVLQAGPERSAQRNAGAHEAEGDFLLFLDSDMEASPGLLQDCVDHAKAADGLCVREVIVGTSYWTRVRSFERARYFRSDVFEAARGFRRETFDRLGGYDPELTGLEDYDLHARFLEAGYRLGWIETPLLHHEENVDLRTYIRKRRYYQQTDGIYALKQPDRWREQRSLRRRLQFILRRPIQPSEMPLLLGWVVVRGLEWVARGSNPKAARKPPH